MCYVKKLTYLKYVDRFYEGNEISGKYFICSKVFIKGYINFSLVTHFLLVLLWVKPMAMDLMTAKNLSGLNRPL